MSSKYSSQQFEEEDHARVYRDYRPDPPDEIVGIIMDYLREKYDSDLNLALDIGCGSGQSTIILSKFFRRVVGSDISEAQIKEANNSRRAANVEYRAEPAEVLPFPDASTQLVTACNALHWCDIGAVLKEVRRVLSPGGVLAVYSYKQIFPYTGDALKDGKIKEIMDEIYDFHLKPYFAKQAFICFEDYKSVDFPFQDIKRIYGIRQPFPGTLKAALGYLRTMSPFQNYRRERGEEASEEFLKNIRERFCSILELKGDDCESAPISLCRDFNIILCRKGDNPGN